MSRACMIGWAHSKFGRLQDTDIEELIARTGSDALTAAGVAAADVDVVYVGHFNAGLTSQEFTASLILHSEPQLRFKPITRVENACASGSAALFQGMQAIDSGNARIALVIGAEKMTDMPGSEVGNVLLRGSYLKERNGNQLGFAGVFAGIAAEYFKRYGDNSQALAKIAAKNHANGVANPYAHMRKDLGVDFCATVGPSNPLVAPPLRRTDCAPVSDGAAAIVLADDKIARSWPHAVRFRGIAHTTDYLPLSRRDPTVLEGCSRAWAQALNAANVSISDLDLIELHDCFTMAELLQYEAMGLAPAGQGQRVILEGWSEKTGRLPINPSGGLKSRGHPIAATGVSMHIMAALQLCGLAGEMQVPNAELAGVFNMGGIAVANYCGILERLR